MTDLLLYAGEIRPSDVRLRAQTQTVSASGIDSGEALGAPSIVLSVAPSGIASTEAFGSLALEEVVAGSSIATAEAFGTPALTLCISLSWISSAEAFGTQAVGSPVAVARFPYSSLIRTRRRSFRHRRPAR